MTAATATVFRAGNTRPRVFASNRAARRAARQRDRRRSGCSRVLAATTDGLNMRRGLLFLNNRYHDPTLGTFISVDPLVSATGEAYIYASGNPTTLSDPSGLCPMDSAAAAACAAAMYHGYNAKSSVYMSASSVLPEEGPWEAWGIWNQADYCSQCEGFDIQAGSGNACFGMSGCAAAAQYLLEASGGLVQSATDEQFATAKWLAANYCNYNECGAGNLLALSNQAEFGAAAAGVLLAGAGAADDLLRAGVSQSLDDQLASLPTLTGRYVRPTGATTAAQRAAVQNLPCVDCGVVTTPMHADHIVPLVREYWETFTIDLQRMRQITAVQPQCPACSGLQGAQLARYSTTMARAHGFLS